LITPKLAALHFYQLALLAPTPPAGSFNPDAAARGKAVFNGPAKCATCHVPPLFTEPGWNMHTPAEIGIDDFQANRAPDKRYRTAPLRGLFAHAKGGFYHDGRFATFEDVVAHYDTALGTKLSAAPVRPTPSTMPAFRAVASTPAAIPCRLGGAAPIRALLFGAMKMPVPSPQTASAPATCASGVAGPRCERRNSPIARRVMPARAGIRVPIRSDIVPASGATNIITSGCEVSSRPARAGPRPRPSM